MRPTLREIFMVGERRPDVFFYTSSVEKYLQARLVLGKFGLLVQHHRSHVEAYDEDYSGTKEHLLTEALHAVRRLVGGSSIVFIEDTSIRIDALSASRDVPGLSAKEWFQETTFRDLDRALKAKKNNRRARVDSDIALSLPGMRRPIFFQASTSGTVAKRPFKGPSSPQYPWLSERNFSAWFIPDGEQRPLSAMDFEDSCRVDFRVQALTKLADRLEEYAYALNLPPASYIRTTHKPTQNQLTMFGQERPVILAIGPTCAGKTTLGEYLCQRHRMRHIEASQIVRTIMDSRNASDVSIATFAKDIMLSDGYDVVARRILELIETEDVAVVVTGFRTIEEIALIRNAYRSSNVVLVDASERTRFERHLKRGRYQQISTIDAFRRHADDQNGFGLLRVGGDFADNIIVNEGTLDEYRGQIDSFFENVKWERHDVARETKRQKKVLGSQLFRLLSALEKDARPLSSAEVATAALQYGAAVRPNNANKVLKLFPELASRTAGSRFSVKYEITDTGRTYLRLSRDMLNGK